MMKHYNLYNMVLLLNGERERVREKTLAVNWLKKFRSASLTCLHVNMCIHDQM